ncbi:hypothetical protein FNF27_00071 [Cafeteria roenbergensis]|uniref:Protein kinase domain-containing protein n=2 Tax=Cafeteria roenbergensis TaxID=33653 RepID=A0A5A8ENB5_CAFRO|nr:hypothetical protein FNF27_00071 [Cafeteria roenbergensis]
MALRLVIISDGAQVDPATGVVQALQDGKVSGIVVADYGAELGRQLPALVAGQPPEPGTPEAGDAAPATLVFDVRLLAACPVEGPRRLVRMRSGSNPSCNARLDALRLGWAARGSRCLEESGPQLGGCLDSWAFDALHQKLLHQAPADEPASSATSATDASSGAAAGAKPRCGCTRAGCNETLCKSDVPISALGYSMGRSARQGDVLGCALDVGGQALEFFLTGDSLEQAFKRVGHDARRGAGRALVPAVSFEATIPSGASRELFQLRVGGPDAAGQEPLLAHRGYTPAGWATHLQAVADEHDRLSAVASGEEGGFVLAGEAASAEAGAPAAGAGAAETASGGVATGAGASAAARSSAAASSDAAAPAAAASSGAKAGPPERDESAEILAEMAELKFNDLERVMASRCWTFICDAAMSDEATKANILNVVFDVMDSSHTILLGRPHPIEGETETVVSSERSGEGLLHAAASAGKVFTLSTILEVAGSAVNVDARSIRGDRATPLHRAAAAGHEAVVVALLGAEASCTVRNASGFTALDLARHGNHASIVQLLCDAMGIPNVRESGLLLACLSGDAAAIAKEASAHSEEVTSSVGGGETPLQVALGSCTAEARPGIIGAFAKAAPSTLEVLRKPGEPLAHTLVTMCSSPLAGGLWDVSNANTSDGHLLLSEGSTAVTCKASSAVVPLTRGLRGPGTFTFTARLVKDKLKDETTLFGFVRNRPKAASYKDSEIAKRSFFVRAYNGDVYGPSGSEPSVSKVGTIHPGQTVSLRLHLSAGGLASVSVATEANASSFRVVRSGVKYQLSDTFYPAVAFYRNSGQIVQLETVARTWGAAIWPLCSKSDAARLRAATDAAKSQARTEGAALLPAQADWSASHAAASGAGAASTRGADPPAPPPRGASDLPDAPDTVATPGELLAALVEGGIPVDECDSQGRSVFHLLAEMGMLDLDVARLVASLGADVTKRCKQGRMPLRVASQGLSTALRVLHGLELSGRAAIPTETRTPLPTLTTGSGGQRRKTGPWDVSSVPTGWFDRVGSLLLDGERVPVRGAALPAPKAGTVLVAGTAVGRARTTSSVSDSAAAAAAGTSSTYQFGVIQADVEVKEGAEAQVDWEDGNEPTRVSVAPGSMGLELLHIDMLGGSLRGFRRFAWPEETELSELTLRFRRRGATRDVSRIAVGMFVTTPPNAPRSESSEFGWVEAVGDGPDGPVQVRWLGDRVESLSLGSGEDQSGIHVIDVDPAGEGCFFLLSGSQVPLDALTSFAHGEALCYTAGGAGSVVEALQRERDAAETAQRADRSAPSAGAETASAAPPSEPAAGAKGGDAPPLVFDPSFCAQVVKLTQGGRTVSAAESAEAAVPVNVNLVSGGVYEVELASVTGGMDSDASRIGVAMRPAVAGEPLSRMWTLTLATGTLKGGGARSSAGGPSVLPGSKVTMRLDLRPGHGTLTFAVDGVEDTLGPAMTGLPTDSGSVFVPVVVLAHPSVSVRVESAVELGTEEQSVDLELRDTDAEVNCRMCGLRIAAPETWVAVGDHTREVAAWSCAVDDAVRKILAVKDAGTKVTWYDRQADQTVKVVESCAIGNVAKDSAIVQLVEDDGTTEWTAHPRSLRVITAQGHVPLLDSADRLVRPAPSCICPTCFMTSKAAVSIDWVAEPRVERDGDAGGVLRTLLEAADASGDSLLAACVRNGSVAMLHTAWQLGTLEASLVRPVSGGSSLLDLAMANVPSSPDADPGAAWTVEGSDGTSRDDDSEDDVLIRSFVKQISTIASRTAARRVFALGSLQGDAGGPAIPRAVVESGSCPSVLQPWLLEAGPLPQPRASHALVFLPLSRPGASATAATTETQPNSSSGQVAWVRLSTLYNPHRLARLASEGIDAADSTEVLSPELWHQLGGVDLLGVATSPAVDCVWLLFGLARRLGWRGDGPAASEASWERPPPLLSEADREVANLSAVRAASQLLQMSILSQLSERERVLALAGARIEDTADALGRTPLHILCAAPLPSPDMVGRLVDRGAKTMATDHALSTPLHCASRCSEGAVAVEVMKILLLPLVEPAGEDEAASRGGAAAASSGAGMPLVPDQRLLKRLAASPAVRAAVNTCDSSGRRPLHFAARCGCWDSTVFLLACGASLEHEDDSASPLYSAVSGGHRHIVSLLCNRGAKVDVSHKKTGFTPLHVAVTKGAQSMVALLLRAGASPEYPSTDGVTPLALARRLQAHNLVGIIHEAISTRAERSTEAAPIGAAAQLAALVGPHLIEPKVVRLGRKLGEGGFGVVMEAELEHMPGTKVVVKQLKTVTALDDDHREMLLQEVKLMRMACSIHHPAVLQFIGLIAEDHGVSSNGRPLAYGLVLDFAAGGSLRSLLDSTEDPVTLPLTSRMALLTDIASGLAFLHAEQHTRQPIAHRDLKPDNILLDQSRTRAMISDFGLSKVRSVAEQATKTSKFATTMQYRAPEVWVSRKARRQRRDQRRGGQTPRAAPPTAAETALALQNDLAQDVFSFGVLMWETVTLLPPFGGDVEVMDISRCIVTERRLPGPLEARLVEEADAAAHRSLKEMGQAEAGAAEAEAECEVGGRDWTDLAWFEGGSGSHPPQAGLQSTQSAGFGVNTGVSSADGADFEVALAGDGAMSDDDDQFEKEDYEAARAMPRSLAVLIARCCSYDPTQRPKSTEVVAELSRIAAAVRLQAHGVEAAPQTPAPKATTRAAYGEFD